MYKNKLSAEEVMEAIKLRMNYDTSKTLTENKKIIHEQTAGDLSDPTTLGFGLTGAVAGAGLSGGLMAGAAAGTAVFPVLGTAIGAVAGIGLGMLGQWMANKDFGKSGFEQVMSACKAPGASKLVSKMSPSEIRTIANQIEDAKGEWNDDEGAIVEALQKIQSVADLCSVDKKVPGGLLEFLDSLTDSPSEWKMFTRPLAGVIEDTQIVLTPEEQKKVEKKYTGTQTGGYKQCSGTYTQGCKSDVISKVQGCLKLTADGKFGPKTLAALKTKGFTSFTDADVSKICGDVADSDVDTDVDVDADNPEDLINS